MFEVGAVQKTRKLARIAIVLGVILLFSSIGITLTSAAEKPGQEQCVDGHGANDDKPCTPDNEHGQDCDPHGNGGVNEDHCLQEESTTGGTSTGSSTGDTSTGSSTGTSTGDTSTGSSTGDTSTGSSTGTSTGDTSTGSSTGDTSTGSSTGTSTGDTSTGSSTGDTSTGSSTGGTSTGSSTGAPVVDNSNAGNEVLGRVINRKPLATTGSTTTVLAVLGFGLLMIGSFLRFGRFGTQKASI